MSFPSKNFALFFLSLFLASIYSSFSFFDGDIAYTHAFDSVFNNEGFRAFWLDQGYPSISLFFYYHIFSFFNSSYELAHLSMVAIYWYSALLLLKLSPSSTIYRLLYIQFFLFSFYSLVLVASAEKMLLAFSFLFLGLYWGLKKNNVASLVFYLFSFLAHASIAILILLINLKYIHRLNYSFARIVKSLKLQLKVHLIPVYAAIASTFFLLPAIISKFSSLFAKEASASNAILLMLIFILFCHLFLGPDIKYYPIIYAFVILLLQIPLGRIAWFSAFFIVLFPYNPSFSFRNMNVYLLMLMSICLYQSYKFYLALSTGFLFS